MDGVAAAGLPSVTSTELVETILLVLGGVLIVMSAARRLPIPYPVLLVLAGLLVGFVPGLPALRLDPGLVFLVFLPPVLWAAAYFTSLRDLRANARPITLLAIGLVVATAAAVSVTARALIPGLDWATAVALGAIVSPPDAVSAVATIRGLGVPRRLVTILEGESLVNDATALILYRAAIAAAVAGEFTLGGSLLGFFVAAAGGVAIGIGVGWVLRAVLRFSEDPLTHTLVSLMAPYAAWILGEHVHASAVLACVAGGLTLRRAISTQAAPNTRLQARAVWDLLIFVVNGVVFLMIGLQLRELAAAVPPGRLPGLVGEGALIALVLVVVRLLWVPAAAWLPRRLSRRLRERDPMPSRGAMFLIGWTGLRGIVSLAAAMALPFTRADGTPFPYRAELILITFVCIFCTLVLQGLSLAPLIEWLGLPRDDEAARELLKARSHAAQHALRRLDEIAAEPWADEELLAPLRSQYEDRLRRTLLTDFGDGDCSMLAERVSKRARFESLMAERLALVQLRDQGVIGDEVLVTLEAELDLEAARHGIAHVREQRGLEQG